MFKSGPTQGSEAGAAYSILRPPGENCLRPEDEASSGEKQGESGVLVGSAERLHQGWFMSMYGKNLENPMDGGAWWAAVYGVAQSRTQLTRLSSSSSMAKTTATV